MIFAIHWHESAMDLHVWPIPIPPATSLPIASLWVFPVHQPWALVSCIQPGLAICFTLDSVLVSMLFSQNIQLLSLVRLLQAHDCCSPSPLSMGFSRQAYWSGLPSPPPGDFPNPGVESMLPVLQVVFCTVAGLVYCWATREATLTIMILKMAESRELYFAALYKGKIFE